jgi:hypothetical protein
VHRILASCTSNYPRLQDNFPMLIGFQVRLAEPACLLVNPVEIIVVSTDSAWNELDIVLVPKVNLFSLLGVFSEMVCNRLIAYKKYRKNLGDKEPSFPQSGATGLITSNLL